jgi:septal ring factor EnvC (AmiA/AmiB activator)
MAGLDRIDVVIGQLVFGGEPVGVMGYADDGRPELYLELRRNNRPVDPLPWFAASEAKVSG